jgi:hypothetical protein
MPRLVSGYRTLTAHPRDVRLVLTVGPPGPGAVDDDDLRAGWELFGADLVAGAGDCQRPWGYWTFELGEGQPRNPADAVVRLAELGELTSGELAALEERANEARLRVGTGRELLSGGNAKSGVSLDAAAVALWERVREALPR